MRNLGKCFVKGIEIMVFDEITSAYTMDGFSAAAQNFFLKNKYQGIILIDLDGFKRINHINGRQTGDALLKLTVREIYNIVPNALIGRTADDEFAVFLTKIDNKSQLVSYAAKIVESSRSVKNINGAMVMCTLTAGVIDIDSEKYAKHAFNELMSLAEFAMSTGKRAGGNRYVVYTDDILEKYKRNDYIKKEIQRIISTDDALYKYQPIANIETGKIGGFEMLARMTENSSEIISPEELFHIAREFNMMRYFDIAALKTACNALKSLHECGADDVYISVNVSPEFFLSPEFSETIMNTTHELGVNMKNLVIELTEDTFISSYEQVKAVIDALVNKGIRFYVDDFGTGYSNLTRLQELNMSVLKLDKSLVDRLEVNSSLVSKSIEIARIFNMKVVAEGVETEGQLQLLKELGCDMGQGYYFGKPMNFEDMKKLIQAQ